MTPRELPAAVTRLAPAVVAPILLLVPGCLNRPEPAAAVGPAKVPAIKAALAGRLINGLITDEATARTVLG